MVVDINKSVNCCHDVYVFVFFFLSKQKTHKTIRGTQADHMKHE